MTRKNLQTVALLATALLIPATLVGQDSTTTTTKTVKVPAHTDTVTTTTHKKTVRKHVETASERELRELREQMAAQQQQIDALKVQLAGKDAQVQSVTQTAADAQAQAASAASSAAAANSAATQATTQVQAVSSTVADLKSTTAGLSETVVNNQKKVEAEIESPSAIHYKGVLLQPGGFAAAETVTRTRTLNSDIATPFSAIPYMNSGNAHISEFNGSVRQSRLSLNVTAPMSWGKAGAYFETDFLGAGTASNNNQTNSYVLRVRSAFGYVTFNNGFTFQGGQMFTLATEDKKGVLAGPGAEALPPTIDPNYIVGFNFGRQYGLRFAQSFAGGKASAAFSVEGSQIILAGTSNAPDNFIIGGSGSTAGLFNSTGNSSNGTTTTQNYSNNIAPDLLAKVAFDPGIGHYEIGGIVRFFRDRVYPQAVFCTALATTTGAPCTSATNNSVAGAFNATTPGGGFFASARVPAGHFVDVALKVAAGDGTGRYGASNLGDVTVRPSGLLEPLRDAQSLFELDLHPTKKFDIFALGGVEYLQRTSYLVASSGTSATGVPSYFYVGYAPTQYQNDTGCSTQAPPSANGGYVIASGTCSGSTRVIEEGNIGLTYRFFNSPTKGRFQMQVIYEYLTRTGWNGITSGSYNAATNSYATGTTFGAPKATENMVHTSFRYYIP